MEISTTPLLLPFYYFLAIFAPVIIFLYLGFIKKLNSIDDCEQFPSYQEIPSNILREVASKKKLEELNGKIDIAIIGSGMGALSSAAVLSRCGYKVIVFEQHEIIGGSTHTFTHEGFEFDVGVHYVGGYLDDKNSPSRKLFDLLSDGKLEWAKLDEKYDVMFNAKTGERLCMTGDPAINRKTLLSHFSYTKLDGHALDRYESVCQWARGVGIIAFMLKALPPFVLKIIWPLFSPFYHHFCLGRTTDVMRNDCDLPEEVIGALTYHYGDIGTPPGRNPIFMQAMLENHYHGGGFFPKGGSSAIAKTLVAAIKRRGGKVFALSKVQAILTEKTWTGSHRAVGVRVHGVDIKVKKCVISDAGFSNTFGYYQDESVPLVANPDARALQVSYLEKFGEGSIAPSAAFFLLAIGLDCTDEELNLQAQNLWHFQDWNHDEYFRRILHEKEWNNEDIPFVFISNESAKDPDYNKRHPSKSTITAIAIGNYDWFKPWLNTSHHHRAKEYEEMKLNITERMLDIVYKHYPQIYKHVVFAELGTPLTVNKFLGRKTGEIYNLDHTAERFGTLGAQLALHPQTTVKNLFMTGQDAASVSIMSCALSGYMTAGRVSLYAFLLHTLPTLYSLQGKC